MKEISPTLSIKNTLNYSAPSPQDIRQILLDGKAKAKADQQEKIISVAQKLPLIDPLQILQHFDLNHQVNFYWENQENQEAILGVGAVQQLKIEDSKTNRFWQAQQQIKTWQQQLICVGDQDNFLPQNHFFCSFTFSEQSQQNALSPFPLATLILPQLQVIKKQNRCVGIQNFLIHGDSNIEQILENYYDQRDWKRLISSVHSSLDFLSYPQVNLNLNHLDQNLNPFRQSVISALKSIEEKKFSKLVIAHVVDLVASTPFPLIQALKNLRKHYHNCYIFALGNGEGSHFLGASPERLLKIHNQQFVTDAIAGSAPRGSTPEEDFQRGQTLLNNDKERREHQSVVTFISQQLQQLGLTVKTTPTTLLKLSNIQHLWTPIYSHLPTSLNPLEMVGQLHPTPAVSGVPTAIACQEITRYEPFDRSLYAAPIGWIDQQGNSQFVVGIRSALITGNQARLYAGAGIVAGSNPDQEVAEIQLKLQAMLKTLL